jgi:hypothetical protein
VYREVMIIGINIDIINKSTGVIKNYSGKLYSAEKAERGQK